MKSLKLIIEIALLSTGVWHIKDYLQVSLNGCIKLYLQPEDACGYICSCLDGT